MDKGYIYCEKPEGVSVFDCLGTTFENVCAIPASFLKLSKKTSELVVNKFMFKDGKPFRRFSTLGDFASTNYKDLFAYVFEKTKSEEMTNKIMLEIQMELAKYALTLSRCTFTVYDIGVDKLRVNERAREYLNTHKYKTIGDLQLNFDKIARELDEKKHEREIKSSLIKAMTEYGVSPEGYPFKLKLMLASIKTTHPLATLEKRQAMFFPAIAKNCKYKKPTTLKSYNWPTPEFYKTTPCDYSALIDYIRVGFKNIQDFGNEIGVEPYGTFNEIMKGQNLTSEKLKKIGDFFNLNLQSIVKFNTGKNIKIFNKSPSLRKFKDYDYTPLLEKIRAEYGYQVNFLQECNISVKTMRRISRGEIISMQSLKEICRVLHCQPQELYTKIQKDEEAPEQKPQTECDYSQLFDLIKKKLLMSNVEFAERAGISLKTMGAINRGKYIGREKLEKIANCLGTSVEKIVVIKDPKVISLDLTNQTVLTSSVAKERIDSAREIDYTPLLEKIKNEFGNFDAFKKKLFLSRGAIQNIKNGKPLLQEQTEKICRYFDCKPAEIMASLEGKPVEEKEKEGECDYTKLLKIIDTRYKNIYDFARDCGNFGPKLVRAVLTSKPISAKSYKVLLNFLGVQIEDIVEFRDEEQKQKVYADLKKEEEKEWARCLDYSGLEAKLAENSKNAHDAIKKGLIGNDVLAATRLGKPITKTMMKSLCARFNCEEKDLVAPMQAVRRVYVKDRDFLTRLASKNEAETLIKLKAIVKPAMQLDDESEEDAK